MALTLLTGLVVQTTPATAAGTCTTKPAVFPEDQLTNGMTATGWTVIQGTTPTSFDVEILGVLPDGIAPGLDFILAKITGPPSFLDATGGIVAGMSGSPVYINDQLVGSTSYGFFAADQTIMGITPAQPMVDLFDNPLTATTARQPLPEMRLPAKVKLSPALRQAAAEAAGVSASTFPASAKQLPVPLAVSGLNQRAMARLNRVLDHFKVPVVAYATGGTSVQGASAAPPVETAGVLAAGLSYGDLTLAAIGTATATCGNLAVGFGHPFTFRGGVRIGMGSGEVLSVIPDPSNIFGGFKLATVDLPSGLVEQDRLAGIRGVQGLKPALVPLIASIRNRDLQRTREGETDIMRDMDLGPFFIDLPYIAAFALLSEEDAAFDRIGDGSASLEWVIRGTDPDGEKFRLKRDDKWYSSYDATISTIFDLYGQLRALQRFEGVKLGRIQVTGSLTEQELTTRIVRVLSASDTQRGLRQRDRLFVHPGDTVHLRVVMKNFGAAATRNVNLTLEVPQRALGSGAIAVHQGYGGYYGFFGGSNEKGETFADLVQEIENAPHNYDLMADMFGRGRIAKVPPAPLARRFRSFHVSTTAPQGRVVEGYKVVRIRVLTG